MNKVQWALIALISPVVAFSQVKPYQGSLSQDNPEYKQVWLSGGKQVEATQAFQDAAAGKEVFKCQNVEVQFNKNGTGVSLKNKKRKVSL